jgi:hypothetical protein
MLNGAARVYRGTPAPGATGHSPPPALERGGYEPALNGRRCRSGAPFRNSRKTYPQDSQLLLKTETCAVLRCPLVNLRGQRTRAQQLLLCWQF